MVLPSLIQLFERDLLKLKKEVKDYKNEADLWKLAGDINNSAGNLCLHVVGNLNHYIGATLGETAYQRDRDAEFANKGIPRAKMLASVDETAEMLKRVLGELNPDDLSKTYPPIVFPKEMTIYSFLIHLYGHMNYHIGQINYHRRLLQNDSL